MHLQKNNHEVSCLKGNQASAFQISSLYIRPWHASADSGIKQLESDTPQVNACGRETWALLEK